MKALLIIAHGSRNETANDEVCRLAESIAHHAGPLFDEVAHAYLEIADPRVDVAIGHLLKAGVTEIKVFPYFLASGTHVASDIPRLIDEAGKMHPQTEFSILPYLGALQEIPGLILKQIGISTDID